MIKILIILTAHFFTLSVLANEDHIVDESQLKDWGYLTQKGRADYDYKKLNDLDEDVAIRYQFIRSIEYVEGSSDTYYYFELSEECFPSRYRVFIRWLTLRGFDDKEYKMGKVSGACVRIVDTSANFGTYNEQPRIFSLYNEYFKK